MAGHIQDRWYKTEPGPDGKPIRVKSDRYGKGLRYRARYIGPDGTEKNKSFPDRQKRKAEEWLTNIEADMSRGIYINPQTVKVTFRQYAEDWLKTNGGDPNTQASMESQLRRHAFPYIGSRPIGSFQPSHIRAWVAQLEENRLSAAYIGVIYANVRTVMSAIVDDGFLPRSPFAASSVRPPAIERKRLIPWTPERIFAVRSALPDRYGSTVDLGAGCGLRQGEILGVSVDELDFESDTLHVLHQLKLSRSKPIFALPKGGKVRDVPLPKPIADSLRAHMDAFKPVDITLPWGRVDGPKVTKRLIFTGPGGGIVWRGSFNTDHWKHALVEVGVIPRPAKGETHAAARAHGMHALRHFYASVLLDAGESITAVSEFMGHTDPGLTLRVYAHLMPNSKERSRAAVAAVYEKFGP